jgi:hypothetical protein
VPTTDDPSEGGENLLAILPAMEFVFDADDEAPPPPLPGTHCIFRSVAPAWLL